jgi:hypothetical protein
MVDINMPVVECGYVPFFADVLSVYAFILLFFRLKVKFPTHFLYLRFLSQFIHGNSASAVFLKLSAISDHFTDDWRTR